MKTHEKLRERNFHSIKMIEVRQRQYDGRAIELELPDVGRVAKGPVEQEPSSKRIKIGTQSLYTQL